MGCWRGPLRPSPWKPHDPDLALPIGYGIIFTAHLRKLLEQGAGQPSAEYQHCPVRREDREDCTGTCRSLQCASRLYEDGGGTARGRACEQQRGIRIAAGLAPCQVVAARRRHALPRHPAARARGHVQGCGGSGEGMACGTPGRSLPAATAPASCGERRRCRASSRERGRLPVTRTPAGRRPLSGRPAAGLAALSPRPRLRFPMAPSPALPSASLRSAVLRRGSWPTGGKSG